MKIVNTEKQGENYIYSIEMDIEELAKYNLKIGQEIELLTPEVLEKIGNRNF